MYKSGPLSEATEKLPQFLAFANDLSVRCGFGSLSEEDMEYLIKTYLGLAAVREIEGLITDFFQ